MRIAIFVASLLVAASALGAEIVGVASVIDGDTIEIHGQRIRLFGIDAPEGGQLCVRSSGEHWRCGQQGSLALSDRVGRATIRCEPRDIDRYHRVVAVCFKGSEDLNRWMVVNGWAVAFRRYSRNYVADEDAKTSAQHLVWRFRHAMGLAGAAAKQVTGTS